MTGISNRAALCELFAGEGVELGVARGTYSETILSRSRCTRLWSIDRWNDHHGASEALHAICRLVTLGKGRCIPLRMTFAEALPSFTDGSLDFAYIDGYAHTGQEGGKTLDDWWLKVRPGGIFAGHDYDTAWQPTVAAVDAFARKHSLAINTTVASPDDPYPSWWVHKPQVSPVAASERVILVGNGPGVLQSALGHEIDAFDQVVRFNAFAIRGFEAHVGTRTDLWTTTGPSGAQPSDIEQRPQRAIYIHGPSTKPPAFPVSEIYPIPRSFFNDVRREIQERTTRAVDQREHLLPTSGLLVALWLVREHGVTHLTLHGFDHFSKAASPLHHYWVNKSYGQPSEHDGECEARMFAELVAAGRVRYLSADILSEAQNSS